MASGPRALLLALLVASASAFVLPCAPRRATLPAISMQEEAPEEAAPEEVQEPSAEEKLKTMGSQLTITPEQRDERNQKKQLINRLLPGALVAFLLIDFASGGKLNNLEIGLPGPGPPGLEEARALKKEKGYF